MLPRSATLIDCDRLTARVTATRTSGARLDAHREGDTFFIDIDLPGVDPAGVDVTVDRQVLTVRAERKRSERGLQLVADRPTGMCTRQVLLSDTLDTDRLEARYDHGVLTLRIPMSGTAKPRTFEITTTELPAAA